MALSDLLARLFRHRGQAGSGRMDRHYVSDFTHFMDRYLATHPQELKTQWTGWRIYWDKRVDFKAEAKAASDSVPDDAYGFRGPEWFHPPPPPAGAGAPPDAPAPAPRRPG